MDLQRVREIDDRHRRRLLTRGVCLPDRPGDQRLFGPFIRLNLFRIVMDTLDVSKRQIIDELSLTIDVHVTSDVRKLVEETEPKVVEAVVAQRKTYHRRSVAERESSSIKIGLWE